MMVYSKKERENDVNNSNQKWKCEKSWMPFTHFDNFECTLVAGNFYAKQIFQLADGNVYGCTGCEPID